MKITELTELSNVIDPSEFSEKNQEILLKELPPIVEKLKEFDRKLKLELYLAEKFKGKSDDEYMEILVHHGLR